ncbi:MAG: aldo/keto reductase [Candidatus Hydrogenedens sp.]|nr:aldo/keto reductase [Candidatus Hydrogenedens sp.]
MQYRRFGKTGFQIPVVSCGGMRYQQSWNDNDPVSEDSQRNLEACIRRSLELGINHIETARGYGTSELQLGKILPTLPRGEMLVQTKVQPKADPKKFIADFEHSMELLGLDYVDIFSFHGINTAKELEWTKRCFDIADGWRKEGRIRDIGFSTHASTQVIMDAIQTGLFEHVNLHWYYIFQDNWPCIEEAARRDMGVFIISPNDKGGRLYDPTDKLRELCAPLHPMAFNGLWCLRRPEVHTLSCGVARPSDFDIHVDMVSQLDQIETLLPPIEARLEAALAEAVGEDYARTWREGLPEPEDTPGELNLPVMLRLRNLALAFDMIEYGKMRYNLLGSGGTWFSGKRAEAPIEDAALAHCLTHSPHAQVIPGYLRETHQMLAGAKVKRLQQN